MPSFYVLDVDHGNSAVLIDQKGVVVIDAGPKNEFPTKEVVETVAKTLDNVQMFSTRSSEVLGRHIEKNANKLHQDGVGHIHLDCKSLKLKFIK
jgi:hypothetical protein